jgi:hypothetical protein
MSASEEQQAAWLGSQFWDRLEGRHIAELEQTTAESEALRRGRAQHIKANGEAAHAPRS